MFSDLGTLLPGNNFKNQVYSVGGHTQEFYNTLSAAVTPTDGLQVTSGQTHSITGVRVTDQRAIGIQMWLKGFFSNNQNIIALSKNPSTKPLILSRNNNDFKLTSTIIGTALTFSFPNAETSLSSTAWVLVGMSIGWMGRNNDFMV